jgi:fructoselysine-6-P-deglycase FrlB-like protein
MRDSGQRAHEYVRMPVMTGTGNSLGAAVRREIRSQPDCWLQAADLLEAVGGVLPQDGQRVAVLGCGTSWFMAQAYAALREAAGRGETDAFAASQFPAARRYDRVIAISRSGTTTEVTRAIERTAAPVTAITGIGDCPVTEAADDAIVLDFADEESVVQTVFATTTLMLLRASLGSSLDDVVAQARRVLDDAAPYDAALADVAQVTYLGQDWAYGIALEAALKMREAAQLWTEAYPQMEYRHGPIAIAEPHRAVWVFGSPVSGLIDDIAGTGALVVNDDLDPVADLVRAQLFAVARAQARGLDPDRPRHLTRSVVLSR